MKALRVHIQGFTTSFRYPGFIVGFQPTLQIPPLSTIYGLISAAKGQLTTPEDVKIGYIFNTTGKGVDVETIYELQKGRIAKSNIIKREFLYEPELYLYINDIEYSKYFIKPYYPLVLGRSSDLVKVTEVKMISLESKTNIKLGKTILPFGVEGAHGVFQTLPTFFTDDIPRNAKGVKPFILMNQFFNYTKNCYYDKEKEWGVWFHETEGDMGKK